MGFSRVSSSSNSYKAVRCFGVENADARLQSLLSLSGFCPAKGDRLRRASRSIRILELLGSIECKALGTMLEDVGIYKGSIVSDEAWCGRFYRTKANLTWG